MCHRRAHFRFLGCLELIQNHLKPKAPHEMFSIYDNQFPYMGTMHELHNFNTFLGQKLVKQSSRKQKS